MTANDIASILWVVEGRKHDCPGSSWDGFAAVVSSRCDMRMSRQTANEIILTICLLSSSYAFLSCFTPAILSLRTQSQAFHFCKLNHVRYVVASFIFRHDPSSSVQPHSQHLYCRPLYRSTTHYQYQNLALTVQTIQAAMATDPSTLLSLPLEMMEAVANELPEEDLPYLRLACRDINSKVTHSFERRCMTNRSFILGSSRSMQNLEGISKDAHFSKTLNRITLVLKGLHYSSVELGLKKWAAEIKTEEVAVKSDHRGNISNFGICTATWSFSRESSHTRRETGWMGGMAFSFSAYEI